MKWNFVFLRLFGNKLYVFQEESCKSLCNVITISPSVDIRSADAADKSGFRHFTLLYGRVEFPFRLYNRDEWEGWVSNLLQEQIKQTRHQRAGMPPPRPPLLCEATVAPLSSPRSSPSLTARASSWRNRLQPLHRFPSRLCLHLPINPPPLS
jgi:hypothetical protein